ncbi:MAG: S8 family serine peptidase [Thermoplasmata archaeon]|nr:MAG: S8 family serine peptidase [Thermoplasmata archaeon]
MGSVTMTLGRIMPSSMYGTRILRKHAVLIVIVAMTLPGLLAVMPSTHGLPERPSLDGELLTSEVGAGAQYSGPSEIHLVAGSFDPLEDTIALPEELVTHRWDGLFLVQLIGPTLPQWTRGMEDIGCRVVSYIPDNAFIVKMTREGRRDVVDLPYVRWVGPFHSAFRVSPDTWDSPDPFMSLAILAIDDPRELSKDVSRLGGYLDHVGEHTRLVQALVPRAGLMALARHPDVEWIEPRSVPELHNDNSARLIGSRQITDGPWNLTQSMRLWSWNDVTGEFEGITGEGFVVSAADTGLDGAHGNFPNKVPSVNYVGGDANRDTYGHGTHVLGTIAGVGLPYPTDTTAAQRKYIGVAPGATVFSQDIFDGFNFYGNFEVLGRDASQRGAVVNSNSWGEMRGGRYTSNEVVYDTMVRDADGTKPGAQPLVFCFSAGNSGGRGDRTMGSPASAKNIISVGATGNDKNGVSSTSVAGFSSRGPTADGRTKPDVVASGAHVVSSAARRPTTMPFSPPADGGESWTSASGTSMSCPATAGAVAQVYDFSNTIWGHNPSPALVKALLINGADKLNSDPIYPGTKQGWGRVNLTKLIETPDYRTFYYDQDEMLQVGGKESKRYIYQVEAGQRTVKFTLAWTDYVGSPSASKALVSDLDLVVTDPDGNVYIANNFNVQGHSLPGDDLSNDTINNVEKIVLPSAKAGFWSATVFARDTPNGPQNYAFVAQGDLQDKWRDLVAENVTLNKEEVDEGEGIVFTGDIVAMGNLPFAPFHYEVYVHDLDSGEKITFEENDDTRLVPWQSIHFTHRWVAVRGDWEFVVDVDTLVVNEEFVKDNNRVVMGRFVKGYGMLTDLLPAQVTVWPGLETRLEVNVLNTGNVVDTYTLSTEGIPVGWSVSLDNDDITLGVEKTGTIAMRVTPPSAAKAGERFSLNVKVTSTGNSTYMTALSSDATVGQVHGLDSELSKQGSSVLPGNSVVHEINVTNTGNGEDSYYFDVFNLPDGWQADFSDEDITLEDNVTKVVTLELSSPEEALSGTIAELDITVTSSTGQSETLKARTQVRKTTAMDATMRAENHVMPGQKVTYTIDIHNLGNGNDNFFYDDQVPKGWYSTIPIPEVLGLEAFESFNVTGELFCPPNARSGEYTFTVQIYTREYLREMTVTVYVEEVFDASHVLLGSGSAVYPGDSTRYSLGVTSLCNLPTDFTIELTGAPTDWVVTYDPDMARLDPFKEQQFDVLVTTPKTTPSSFYHLQLVLSYGPIVDTYNMTLYVMDTGTDEPDGGGGSDEPFLTTQMMMVLLIVVIVVIVIAAMLSRRGGDTQLSFEEPGSAQGRRLPPPPPPAQAQATERRLPPPPPPAKPPETVEELLSDTSVMDRMSDEYDMYSADSQYATGATIAEQGEPFYVGDCPRCGGKVMEYPSGSLMCSNCGSQFTED